MRGYSLIWLQRTAIHLLFLASLCYAPLLAAQEYAGLVKVSSGDAAVERAGQKTPLTVGTRLHEGDRILTGKDGGVGITLRDDTRVSIGPNASVSMDRFRFNSTTHEGQVSVGVLQGALRMVTGLIGRRSHESVSVSTPTITAGIRGTDFIVEVDPGN